VTHPHKPCLLCRHTCARCRAVLAPRLVDVLLFGSQARGDAGDGSDIDVMVILDHPTDHDLSEARGLAFDI